ncbi:VCBS repeat-containing protein [Chloracidobacterium thermophilum]|uniref:VCBS repeat-containing protein n=1 Tax=Chloracidobacterium thermophilum TaxID=458033 RepID=UPI0007385688|nr:VCBS repeat-containing protein [Chloracidobacterium thermophilum]
MVFRRRWHPIWLLCLALASLPGLSSLASRADTSTRRPASLAHQTVPAGPLGHVITHLDGDHLPDTVSGRTTAGGRYLIEVHLSSQPKKVTITANGFGFAVQDVNADNLVDLLVADGLGGRFIHLENDGNGAFTPCVARKPLYQSGPRPTDSATAADWLTKSTRPSQPAAIFWRLVFTAPAIEPHRARFCPYRSRTPYESVAGLPSRAPPPHTRTTQTTPI